MAARKTMNLKLIGGNIAETIEALEKLQDRATNGTLTEGTFR
jgi:hypothetical protein